MCKGNMYKALKSHIKRVPKTNLLIEHNYCESLTIYYHNLTKYQSIVDCNNSHSWTKQNQTKYK